MPEPPITPIPDMKKNDMNLPLDIGHKILTPSQSTHREAKKT
jgi:hypothetical protein